MTDFKIIKTDSTHPDFVQLVQELDAYLSIRNGEADAFFRSFNAITFLKNVVVVYDNDTPIGCGAFKKHSETAVEIKRMFTHPTYRGRGVGGSVLASLEAWATELDFTHAVLETGKDMLDAVGLYQKLGYAIIPNYDQYENVETSVCFEKALKY